jgi:hypothetical protein
MLTTRPDGRAAECGSHTLLHYVYYINMETRSAQRNIETVHNEAFSNFPEVRLHGLAQAGLLYTDFAPTK